MAGVRQDWGGQDWCRQDIFNMPTASHFRMQPQFPPPLGRRYSLHHLRQMRARYKIIEQSIHTSDMPCNVAIMHTSPPCLFLASVLSCPALPLTCHVLPCPACQAHGHSLPCAGLLLYLSSVLVVMVRPPCICARLTLHYACTFSAPLFSVPVLSGPYPVLVLS